MQQNVSSIILRSTIYAIAAILITLALWMIADSFYIGYIATHAIVEEYHFGAESMVAHGGWGYTSRVAYFWSSLYKSAIFWIPGLILLGVASKIGRTMGYQGYGLTDTTRPEIEMVLVGTVDEGKQLELAFTENGLGYTAVRVFADESDNEILVELEVDGKLIHIPASEMAKALRIAEDEVRSESWYSENVYPKAGS